MKHMKSYTVYYRLRGAENAFMPVNKLLVLAGTKKEAREEAYYQIGDIYRILKVELYFDPRA